MSLFSGELAVAVAYWHTGPAARAVMQLVWSYPAIMEQETGWEVYDGQLGRSLDRAHDFDEVTGWYSDSTAWLHRRFPEALSGNDLNTQVKDLNASAQPAVDRGKGVGDTDSTHDAS